MTYPKRIETTYVETLAAEVCVYDWERKQVHALNPMAAFVFGQCDGQTSPAQIAARLQSEFNTANGEELVWMSLARLEKARLLEQKVVAPSGAKVLTRRQMLQAIGVGAALLPVVASMAAPSPIQAQSCNANCQFDAPIGRLGCQASCEGLLPKGHALCSVEQQAGRCICRSHSPGPC